MKAPYAILDPSARAAPSSRGCALAVMIKAPRAGASKTRLVPPLTHEEAASLSVCFLRDTASNIAAACEAAEGAAQGVAVYTPVGAESAFDDLLPANFSLLAQRGENFGERLFHAATDLLACGFDSLCLIDSDSPTLPTGSLVAAVDELSKPGERLVIGAADDGGYYLIGIKSAHARLFEEIDWSTARVFSQTLGRAREIDLHIVELPAWYDVDDAATLARLCAELFDATDSVASCDPVAAPNVEDCDGVESANAKGYAAPHTRDFLASLIAREGRARIWREGADESDETASTTGAHTSSAGAEATS